MPTRLNYDASRAHESCQAETEKQSTYRRVWDIRPGRTERHRHVIDVIKRRMITALKLQDGGAAGSEEIGKRLRDYRVSADPLFFLHFGRRVVLWRLAARLFLDLAAGLTPIHPVFQLNAHRLFRLSPERRRGENKQS